MNSDKAPQDGAITESEITILCGDKIIEQEHLLFKEIEILVLNYLRLNQHDVDYFTKFFLRPSELGKVFNAVGNQFF